MVLIRFWRSLTKKDSVRVLDMIYKIFSTLTLVLGRFFHGSGFFRIGSGFLADPYQDSEKKSGPDTGKKPDPKHWLRHITCKLRRPGAFGSLVTMEPKLNKNTGT